MSRTRLLKSQINGKASLKNSKNGEGSHELKNYQANTICAIMTEDSKEKFCFAKLLEPVSKEKRTVKASLLVKMKEDLHDIRYQIQNDIMVNHTDILKEILLHDNYQTKDNFVFQIYPSTQKMIEKFSLKPQKFSLKGGKKGNKNLYESPSKGKETDSTRPGSPEEKPKRRGRPKKLTLKRNYSELSPFQNKQKEQNSEIESDDEECKEDAENNGSDKIVTHKTKMLKKDEFSEFEQQTLLQQEQIEYLSTKIELMNQSFYYYYDFLEQLHKFDDLEPIKLEGEDEEEKFCQKLLKLDNPPGEIIIEVIEE